MSKVDNSPSSAKFSLGEVNTILCVFLFTSTLAVISQLFIMIFYLIYVDLRNKKNFCYRLIFLLSFSDIIVWGMRVESNLEKIISNNTVYEYSVDYCVFLGILWNFFLLVNILITFVISFCLVLELFFLRDSQKHEKKFYAIILIYSLFFSLVPLIDSNAYGEDDQIKCWITDEQDSKYRYLAFYGHLWLVFILNSINIIAILWKLRAARAMHAVLVNKLIWFPIIMFIFWIEPSVRRISDQFARYGEKSYELALIQYISMPAQGVANAVVYGLVNHNVKMKVQAFFKFNWAELRVQPIPEQNLLNNEAML